MNFLNKIGQRNAAKYLIFISVIISLSIYGLKYLGFGSSQVPPNIVSILIGTLVFSLGNILLCITAHKSKEFRLISVFASSLIVFLNVILFSLTLKSANLSSFLFIVALVETILSAIFLFFVLRKEKLRRQIKSRSSKNKIDSKATIENTIGPSDE